MTKCRMSMFDPIAGKQKAPRLQMQTGGFGFDSSGDQLTVNVDCLETVLPAASVAVTVMV